MDARRGDPDQHVAGLDLRPVDEPAAFDDAHREPRDVVLAAFVHARHLGRLTAYERTARLTAPLGHAADDALDLDRFVVPHGHIIEKKERLGTLSQHVVDAHRHGIDADRIVFVQREGQFELGSHAVGTAYEHRLLDSESRQIEHAAEGADRTHDARARRRSDVLLDAADHLVTGFEIHAGLLITFCHIVFSVFRLTFVARGIPR